MPNHIISEMEVFEVWKVQVSAAVGIAGLESQLHAKPL